MTGQELIKELEKCDGSKEITIKIGEEQVSSSLKSVHEFTDAIVLANPAAFLPGEGPVHPAQEMLREVLDELLAWAGADKRLPIPASMYRRALDLSRPVQVPKEIKIKLVNTRMIQGSDDRFAQEWEVNGELYSSQAQWGDVDICKAAGEKVLFERAGKKVNVADVIGLAIHGHGPTVNGQERVWTPLELLSRLIEECLL